MNRALQECIYFQGFYPVDNKEIFMQGQHVKTDNTQSTLESFFGKIVASVTSRTDLYEPSRYN